MAKKACSVCGKELGLFASALTTLSIADGIVCQKCLTSAGISALPNAKSYSASSLNALISRRKDMIRKFSKTKSIGDLLTIDETNKLFKAGADLFAYENLLGFELLEDGETITKSGGLGRAVVGGVLFGGVGAVVGGVTAGKKTKAVCTSMKIKLTLKNAHTDTAYINLITTETKTSSFTYKMTQEAAQKCISALQIISDANTTEANSANASPSSAADEILKFKQLMDTGIITQEEFEAKKRNLLGI